MEIFDIGSTELLIVILLATIILGPERLTKVAREAGRLYRSFKMYFTSLSDELKSELDLLDELDKVKNDVNKIK